MCWCSRVYASPRFMTGELSAKMLPKFSSIWFYDDMNERLEQKTGCQRIEITIGIILLVILVPLTIAGWRKVSDLTARASTAGNCHNLMGTLKVYAGDHGGTHPDADVSNPQTANQAFRLLGAKGMMFGESVFGAAMSPYRPDGDLGTPPAHSKALEPGENHWALTKGATDASPALLPIVFENAVTNTWPPRWNADAAGRKVPGRAWRDGKIIVGFNDASVMAIQLESAKGASVAPKLIGRGKDYFTLSAEKMEVLDIER